MVNKTNNRTEVYLKIILFAAIFLLLFFGSNTSRFQCDEKAGPCYSYSGKPDGHFILSKTNPLIAPFVLLAVPILRSSNDLSITTVSLYEIMVFDKTPANGGPLLFAYFLIKLMVLINIALWSFLIYLIARKIHYPVFALTIFFVVSLVFILCSGYFINLEKPNGMNIFSYLRYLQD